MNRQNIEKFEVKKLDENKYEIVTGVTQTFYFDGQGMLQEITAHENNCDKLNAQLKKMQGNRDKMREYKKDAQTDFQKFQLDGQQSRIKDQAKHDIEKYTREKILAEQIKELKKEISELKKCIKTDIA